MSPVVPKPHPAIQETGRQTSRPNRRSVWPVIGLFFASPLVAEFLLGNLPIKLLGALILLGPMYGGGALLVRETARRARLGWPGILLLGMAFGIYEEAFLTQSLFNPNYLKANLGLMTPAYIPVFGISAWWTLFMLMVHGIWSISTPIAILEACVPQRSRTPWLGRAGLSIVVVLFILGSIGTALVGYRQDPFMASKPQFVSAAVVLLLLILAAFRLTASSPAIGTRKAPSAPALGGVALVLASAVMFVPKDWGWGAVATLLALDAAMLLAIFVWSRKGSLALEHQLALGAGAALAYGWHAFIEKPAVGVMDPSVRFGNAIFLTLAIAWIAFAARQVRTEQRAC